MPPIRTILVVDDDPQFRNLVRPALELRGFAVIEAGTGRAASEVMATTPPDLVIVDGLLPDIKGMAWIEQLRAAACTTPVVFVSAFWKDLHSFRRLTQELNVAVVSHKPVAPALLAEQVEKVLGPPPRDESEPEVEIEFDPLEDLEALTAALRADYVRALPEKLRVLTAAVASLLDRKGDAAVRAEARSLAHRLRGTAGSYGLPEIGDLAGQVEDALVELEDGIPPGLGWWEDVQHNLRALTRAVRAAGGGVPEAGAPVPQRSDRGRLLVVDADAIFCRQIGDLARQQLVDVVTASSAREALALAGQRRPDCAVLNMSTGDDGAVKLARELRALPGCDALPLAFTSDNTTVESRVAAAHAGASLYLQKPFERRAFEAAINHLLTLARPRRPRVLLVNDDSDFARQVAAILSSADIATTHLADPVRILEVLDEVEPDVVLLDSILPGMNGLDVCRMLRTTPRWQDLPVLFVTVEVGIDVRLAAFQAGVDDYLAKPVVAPELLARVRVRLDRARMVRERVSTDALTGLLLRRPFLDAAGGRLAEARRYQRPLTVAILDLDGFKQVNDRHGHLAGDAVLAGMGRLLAGRLRAEDLRARWGGEEFALLFAGQNAETIAGVVERLRREFSLMTFPDAGGARFSVSFSAGVATYGVDGESLDELLATADRRLYAAKRAGRARVTAAG